MENRLQTGEWFHTSMFPGGNAMESFLVATDITQAKNLEEDLARETRNSYLAKEAVELVNRSKDQFLAVISHELRTPLTPITMALSYMADHPLSAEETREMHLMMRRQLDLECRMIDDLLDMMRILRGTMYYQWEVRDVHAAIRDALGICHGDFSVAGLNVAIDLGADRHHVNADGARLRQLFWNLLKNASKFAPRGTLHVSTRNKDQEIVVEFRDSGIGITEEQMRRIFNAFEQGETTILRRHGGLGLGLAIALSVARTFQGSLEAISEGAAKGSLFRVTLPLAPPPAENPPSGLRIFLVEGDPMTRKVIAGLLTRAGFQVDLARSVREAKETFRPPYHVLISDIGLPDGTGLDLVRILKEEQSLPAIALTEYGQDEDVRRAQEAGFDCHLTKPLSFSKLIESIHQVTGRGA